MAATATPGTLIHTALAGSTGFDEIYAWVVNTSGAAVTLTVEFGDATAPDHHFPDALSIPGNSPPIPVLTGQVLNGGLTVKMYAGTANVLNVAGFVNRIN